MFEKLYQKLRMLIMKDIKQAKVKKIKVCDLTPYDHNPYKHTPERIEQLKKDLKEYGSQGRIGVHKDNVICYGHKRYSAFMEINPNMTIEVNDCSYLTDEQAQKFRIKDNASVDNDIDEEKMMKELTDIYLNLEDNIGNISEEMNEDVARIAQKIEKENENYNPNNQRQASEKLAKIILEYTKEDYDRVKELSEVANKKFKTNSTSDLFLKMLEKV